MSTAAAPAPAIAPAADDPLLMPAGTRLLHVGPAKTGTTSLQSGFHRNRDALARHGVHYAGSGSQPRAAAAAVSIGKRIAGHRLGLEAWPELVAEIEASNADRVVISSETFARAGDDAAREVVAALGARRLQVVITMRPLADMLSSSWQQWVQTGATVRYEDWLDEMLNSADTVRGPQPEFWRKTRIDVLARRWSALIGPENVTVVSLAAAPRDFVLRTFERFTGLPSGTLVPDPRAENGSLGFGVVETLRRFNEMLREVRGANADAQAALVEFGAVKRLRKDAVALVADERIEVPRWAADRSAAITAEMIDALRVTGVRVVGDLAALTVPSRPPVDRVASPDAVSAEASARLMLGMALAAGRGRLPTPHKTQHQLTLEAIEKMPTSELLGLARARVTARVLRRLRWK